MNKYRLYNKTKRMVNIMQIGKKCCNCGADDWYVIDENYLYKETCTQCFSVSCIDKRELVRSFECPDCGALSGKAEENDKKFGIRCNNCGTLHIKIDKHTMEDRRQEVNETQNVNDGIPKCPTCGSTSIVKISATAKATNTILFGILGNKRKKQFHCESCGYEW